MPKPFFLRRPSGLYVRFFVPTDLQPLIGSRYLVRRLPPASIDLMRLTAASAAVALSQAFDRIRRSPMTEKDRDALLRALAGTIDRWTGNIELPNGTKLTDLQVNGQDDAQALLHAINGLSSTQFATRDATLPSIIEPVPNDSLATRIDLYLQDLRNAKTSSGNLLDSENTLTIFKEIAGPDVPMSQVSQTHVRAFLGGLHDWPSNARKKAAYKDLSALQIIATVKRQRAKGETIAGLSDRTLGKHRDRLASFLNAQVTSGQIARSPLDGIKRQNASRSVAVLPRRPFRIEEIDQIFDLKNFLAWTQERPDRYWGTLLGAGTGARVNEIAQLYVQDVAEVSGIWGLHIRAIRKDQKLKNANSQRFIPLHPELLRAGFLTYIQDVTAAGHDRVFPQLPWHQKAGYGDALGDQFRAYLTKLDMAQPGFGFHSFRHTASTRLVYAGIPNPIVAAITGHLAQLPGELGTYVQVPTLHARADAIALLPVPGNLPTYMHGDALSSLQKAHITARRRNANSAAQMRRRALDRAQR